MKLLHTASAGTLESSDCVVTVSPGGAFALDYRGANSVVFAKRTETLVRGILEKHSVEAANIVIQDQGAIEITIKARLETALLRAAKGE
ncbi:citrate lyase acyl carrier protein [Cloacibacillus sp. An23]|uniref:citrate lyase acyl carrier protein n=1 Tax=Cloacibacillus sp. An23 TaxID=1965591 RepID=UPI000B369877|nr:citrate lyase acyl carrier protein [Cloacibacillus sp. An23]OUO92776.1 citrate lyase acyl carrier protein [Cloacibacillus sp. An23]